MSSRTDWNNAVMSAEITATPSKVVRYKATTGRKQTFWVLCFVINGREFTAEGDFRYAFKTKALATAAAEGCVAEIRELMTEVGYYFESVDSPESDLVQAVWG
jgi:hypothetical protein